MSRVSPSQRWAPAAPYVALASLLAVAATLVLHRYNLPRAHVRTGLPPTDHARTVVDGIEVTEPLLGALFPVVGWLVLRSQPRNVMGWACLSSALIAFKVFFGEYAVTAYLVHPGLPLGAVAAWLTMWGWSPYLLLLTVVPLFFPDGKLPSHRWRWAAIGSCAATGLVTVVLMVAASPLDSSDFIDNPLGLTSGPVLRLPMYVGIGTIFFVCAPAAVVALVLRQRRARGRERAQMLWGLAGGAMLLGATAVTLFVRGPAADATSALGFASVAVAVVVGTTFYGDARRDVVLNHSLVYAVLTALGLLAYAAAVATADAVLPGRSIGLGAVAVIALLAAMARDWVQRWIDKLLYGDRRDPYAVVTRVGGRLDVAAGPLDALTALVAELAAALKLPFVAVVPVDDALPSAQCGERSGDLESVPITSQGSVVGSLEVGHRHAGERFRDAESSALRDVAGRAGSLLYAASLVSDLQRSRERIVAAREEERRRLRHDLHDGLGPQLAGMALQLESLAGRLDGDSDAAARVAAMRDRMRDMVSDVRRVVDDLRPAALDQLGLVGALRQHAATVSLPERVVAGGAVSMAELRVDVEAGRLPELPAAVEVAAYRIATEAVTNALRHAAARSCTVQIETEGAVLLIEVSDDGHGIPQGVGPGVGLQSMRERAAELGGEFSVLTTDSGTVVSARLPLETR